MTQKSCCMWMIPTNQMWKYISKLNDNTMLHRPTNYNKNWNPRQKVLVAFPNRMSAKQVQPRWTLSQSRSKNNQCTQIRNRALWKTSHLLSSGIEPCGRPLSSFPPFNPRYNTYTCNVRWIFYPVPLVNYTLLPRSLFVDEHSLQRWC